MPLQSIAARQLELGPAGYFRVEPETPPNNQVSIRAGFQYAGAFGIFPQVANQMSAGFAGVNPGQQRYDLVYLDQSGAVQVLGGVEIALGAAAFERAPGWTGANPGPQLPDGIVPLAWIFVDEPLPGAAVVDVSDITLITGFIHVGRHLRGYCVEKSNLGVAPVGFSSVVTGIFAGELPGGSASQPGVITTPTSNVVDLLRYPSRDEMLHVTGARVFGRLTYAAGVWTLSYFYLDAAGVETVVDLSTIPSPPADILLAGVRKVFSDNDPARPLFSTQNGVIVSDQLVGDIPLASITQAGKVELATSAESIAGLAVQADDTRLLTQNENDAAQGAVTGSAPTNANRFVVDDDSRFAGVFVPAYFYGRRSGEASNPYADGLNRINFGVGVDAAGIAQGANGDFVVTAAGHYLVDVSIEHTSASAYDIHAPAGAYTPPTGAFGGGSNANATGHIAFTAILNLGAGGSFEIVENFAGAVSDAGNPHRTSIAVVRVA